MAAWATDSASSALGRRTIRRAPVCSMALHAFHLVDIDSHSRAAVHSCHRLSEHFFTQSHNSSSLGATLPTEMDDRTARMIPEQRQQELLRRLRDAGVLSTRELTDALGSRT